MMKIINFYFFKLTLKLELFFNILIFKLIRNFNLSKYLI